jgi:N-acetylmuramic acid 6-phosphate etherase
VQPTNHKLRERAKIIVVEAANVSLEEAEKALEEYGSTKPAILSLLTDIHVPHIIPAMENNKGHLKNAIKELI